MRLWRFQPRLLLLGLSRADSRFAQSPTCKTIPYSIIGGSLASLSQSDSGWQTHHPLGWVAVVAVTALHPLIVPDSELRWVA